eukprot:TRINITY_DN15471_c0_g2_i6.p1 TRINITY_DN15471_c0_g2~~TRINITY_DN15471_c0_g2_i6.p1  ORF type:complete len:493 (-),score=55.09 TRINITY_DN15471_c0_g2_i6:22-1500(-)
MAAHGSQQEAETVMLLHEQPCPHEQQHRTHDWAPRTELTPVFLACLVVLVGLLSGATTVFLMRPSDPPSTSSNGVLERDLAEARQHASLLKTKLRVRQLEQELQMEKQEAEALAVESRSLRSQLEDISRDARTSAPSNPPTDPPTDPPPTEPPTEPPTTKPPSTPPRPQPSCSDAQVALCMVGNRFIPRQDFGLNDHFIKAVVAPLGGVDNVDVFVSTDPEVVDSLSFRVLMAMLHSKTRALNTRAKLSQPGSLGFGTLRAPPTRQDKCSQANGPSVSTFSPTFKFSTYAMQFRADQCMHRVLEQEAVCKRKYEWVVKDRDDSYYGSPHYTGPWVGSILKGNRTIHDLKPGKVYGYCKDWGWGFCDGNAVVHRTYAEKALLVSDQDLQRCWTGHEDFWQNGPADVKPCAGQYFDEQLHDLRMIPECLSLTKLLSHGVPWEDIVDAAGTQPNKLVVNCNCATPPLALDHYKVCGSDLEMSNVPREEYCGNKLR